MSAMPQPAPKPASSSTPPALPRRPLLTGAACGVALFFGFIFTVNLIAQLRLGDYEYDPNHWWLSFKPLPRLLEQAASVIAAGLFIAYAVVPAMSPVRRRATRTTVELLGVLAGWNVVNFYGGISGGAFRTSFPIPLAFFIAAALACVWFGAAVEKPKRSGIGAAAMVATLALAALVFPILQMLCLGRNDHRPPVKVELDAAATTMRVAAIFGSAVADNGSGGRALTPRGQTAVDLIKQNGVAQVFATGDARGPDSAWAARIVAAAAGVPAGKVELHRKGGDPDATVPDVAASFPRGNFQILAVSDYYQLPRIDMLFAQHGRVTLPVPAEGSPVTLAMMLGEVPKLWKCYLGALVR